VQLGIDLRQGSGNVDFETMNLCWSYAGLALEELWSRLEGNAVEPEGERGIGSGESGKNSGGGRMPGAILNDEAEFGGDDEMSRKLLHLDVGSLRARGPRDWTEV